MLTLPENYTLTEVSKTAFNKEQVDIIKTEFEGVRQTSKSVTFALQYFGTHKTLMTNSGFSEAEARGVVANYHKLYTVSTQYKEQRLNRASHDGYVSAAFNLKVRTPLLHQVIRGAKTTPREAEAEGRTAGNALFQSWCLLNSRAGTEFLRKVRGETPVMGHNGGPPLDFRYSIRPCAQIHDAQYYLIRDDMSAILFANEHVVKACEWQDHPDIWHDEVKLGGTFFLCWPSWEHEIKIPNGADEDQVREAITKYVSAYEEKHGRSLN